MPAKSKEMSLGEAESGVEIVHCHFSQKVSTSRDYGIIGGFGILLHGLYFRDVGFGKGIHFKGTCQSLSLRLAQLRFLSASPTKQKTF